MNKGNIFEDDQNESEKKGVVKVLVGCHDKPFYEGEYSLLEDTKKSNLSTKHWAHDFITNEIKKKYKDANQHIQTVDLMDSKRYSRDPEKVDSAYSTDIFKGPYAKRHENNFDMVFLPDCGGPWYTLQSAIDSAPNDSVLNKMLNKFVDIVRNVMFMVKPGGYLYLGKWIVQGEKRDLLKGSLMSVFNYTEEKKDKYEHPYFVFQKPSRSRVVP